ncbi:MAG: Fic/DOC family N-terminal domain-containing protein [Rhodanobacter sp.]
MGRLDGSVLTLPNPDLFVFMYVRKEVVLSSQIRRAAEHAASAGVARLVIPAARHTTHARHPCRQPAWRRADASGIRAH